MSKTRKILSVVLAVVLVFALSVPAFAYNWEAEDNGYSQTWALGTPVAVEGKTDEYTINVSLETDYATGAVQFVLAFTGDVALTGVTLGDDYYANADLFKDNATGKVMLIPTTSDPNALDATAINGVVAVLTVTGTLGTVAIDENVKSEANQGGTLIAARLDPETLLGTQYVGQESVSAGASVSIGAVAADLALKAGAQAGIIIDGHKFTAKAAAANAVGYGYDGAVYGFTRLAANTFMTTAYLTNNLEATNGGSLEFSRTIGTTGYGTGTLITVKNSDNSVSKRYIVVIFGDVDGNGLINGMDTTALKGWVSKPATAPANNSVVRMAANVNYVNNSAVMHNLIGTDTTALKNYVGNVASANTAAVKLDAVKLATVQNSFNSNYQ